MKKKFFCKKVFIRKNLWDEYEYEYSLFTLLILMRKNL